MGQYGAVQGVHHRADAAAIQLVDPAALADYGIPQQRFTGNTPSPTLQE